MPNLLNKKMSTEYGKWFSSLDGAIFVKFEKHTPEADRELRKALRKEKVGYRVVKNRIARRAIEGKVAAESVAAVTKNLLKGPTAIAFGPVENVIAAAKVFETARKAKSAPGIEVRGAYFQGSVLSVEQVRALAGLPGRKELLSMILGAAVSTASNVPTLAQSALAVPARLVASLIDKREKEGAPAASAAPDAPPAS
jgi:large subunit ribosomal protein L10